MKLLRIFIGSIILCSCDDILQVSDISDEVITIVAPLDNVILNDSIVTFTWEEVEDAENYHLQIARPSFNYAEQIVKDTITQTLNYSSSFSSGSYQWRIRAENSAYITVYSTQSFSVEE